MPTGPELSPKMSFDGFLMTFDPYKLITAIVSIVSLIETLFQKRRKAGPAKKQKALNTIYKLFGKHVDVPAEVSIAIGALVDVAAESGERWKAAETLSRIHSLVAETFDTAKSFIDDDAAARAFVLDFVNGEIDIPGIDEQTEALVIGFMLDLVIAEMRRHRVDAVLDGVNR